MFSAGPERINWSFSLRLALAVGAVFAAAAVAIYLTTGALLDQAFSRAEAALILDRREDLLLAWQEGGATALGGLMHEIETSTGEQLAVKVERPDGTVAFAGATANAPEVPWDELIRATSVTGEVAASGGWTAATTAAGSGTILHAARFSPVRADLSRTYHGLFLRAVVPLLALGLVASVLTLFTALSPLRRTVGVMRHIVRTGDWAARVAVPRGEGEMRNLAEAFNALLERQQQLVARLRQSLDHVAHDLRTPLTRLQVTAESGLSAAAPDNPARESLADCLEEAQRVQATLDTLLDVAEAEAGAMRLRRENLDAAAILAEVAELYEFAAEERGARLEVRAEAGLVFAGDRVRLRRALANLTDNALKYLGDGRTVVLSASASADLVVLQVRDDGMGIAPADLPRIWDRLYRADQSRSAPGMGLGLSLVKAIVEAHDGQVAVDSTPGRGSTFRLLLPRQA